jgi:PadR family transcriptional regulator PadR
MSAEHPNLARDPAAASDPISAETDPNAAPDTDVAPDTNAAPDTDVATVITAAPPLAIASDRDSSGVPIHRGWSPLGTHHRWMEPFVLALLAGGAAHGYAIVGELSQLGITTGAVDVGQVYRTLRDLEEAGQVSSSWMTGTGPARRDYEMTASGFVALDEWAAVMKERSRLVAEFEARYLESVAPPRGPAVRSDQGAEGVGTG